MLGALRGGVFGAAQEGDAVAAAFAEGAEGFEERFVGWVERLEVGPC